MQRQPFFRTAQWIVSLGVCLVLIGGCTLNRTESPAPSDTPTSTPTGSPASAYSSLIVAWSVGGDLFVWRGSEAAFPRRVASGGVIRPFIAPDGQQIAYLRGPGGDPRSLWVIGVGGGSERQVIDGAWLAMGDSTRRIGQVIWSHDAQTIYFNTVTGDGIDTRPAEDLWRVDAATGAAERILEDGRGGQITLSPDGTAIALARAGEYSGAPGRVWLYDIPNELLLGLFEFPAVATASEYRWYPELTWLPDSTALRMAIPDSDLVYGGEVADTALWSVPIVTDLTPPTQIGTVEADFFGLPRFSADGAWITFIQRRATLDQTDLTLMIAAGDGTQPVAYDSGTVGTLGVPAWSASGAWFTYTNGNPGEMWIGGPGGTPLRFPAEDIAARGVVWADPSTYVILAGDDAGYTLRVGLLDIPAAPQVIAQLDRVPAFDAVLP